MARSGGERSTSGAEGTGTRREIIGAGAGAGALGAVAMAAWMMGGAAFHGRHPLAPLRPLGATFLGAGVLDGGGLGVFLYGVLLVAMVSAILGVVFAALLPPDFGFGGAALLGVGYAQLVMAVLTSAVLPAANPVLSERMPSLGGTWVLGYAAFGVALGVAPSLRRRIRRRERAVA